MWWNSFSYTEHLILNHFKLTRGNPIQNAGHTHGKGQFGNRSPMFQILYICGSTFQIRGHYLAVLVHSRWVKGHFSNQHTCFESPSFSQDNHEFCDAQSPWTYTALWERTFCPRGSGFETLKINQLYLSHHCLHIVPPILTAYGSYMRTHLQAEASFVAHCPNKDNYPSHQTAAQEQKEHLSPEI